MHYFIYIIYRNKMEDENIKMGEDKWKYNVAWFLHYM